MGGKDSEKPQWPLSSYGPGRDAPRQLLEGLLEQSFEEARVLCYVAQQGNKLQEYVRTPVIDWYMIDADSNAAPKRSQLQATGGTTSWEYRQRH